MSRSATVHVISRRMAPAPELQILPLERARAVWDDLAASHPEATLYHRAPWLEVLQRAYGVRPSVALLPMLTPTRPVRASPKIVTTTSTRRVAWT